MYQQDSLFPGIDEDKTLEKVYLNLAIYEKSRQHIYLLEPHLQSVQLSADKVQSSSRNASEDDLIKYLDEKAKIQDFETVFNLLYIKHRPILKMRYMDDFGSNNDISVAKKLKLVTYVNGVQVASATYSRRKRNDLLAFAESYQGGRLQIYT